MPSISHAEMERAGERKMQDYAKMNIAAAMNMAANPASQPICNQPVQDLYNQAEKALESLKDEISALDERLGYVYTPENEGVDQGKIVAPEPPRSPMAHNLYCLLCDVNKLSYRVQQMRGRLEI